MKIVKPIETTIEVDNDNHSLCIRKKIGEGKIITCPHLTSSHPLNPLCSIFGRLRWRNNFEGIKRCQACIETFGELKLNN